MGLLSHRAGLIHSLTMNRMLCTLFACALASCGHVATPLPPQPPQESRPIFIISAAQPAANARAAKPKPNARSAPVAEPTPDVVGIAWSLRNTEVWVQPTRHKKSPSLERRLFENVFRRHKR